MAEAFGAIPQENITSSTTHCVTANPSTEKAYKVNKAGGKVVWTDWFWQSVAEWRRLDETPFLAIQKPEAKPPAEAVENGAPSGPLTDTAEDAAPDAAADSSPTEPAETTGDGDEAVDEPAAATASGAPSVDDPDFDAGEWNDDDEKEWAEFMDGEGEGGSGSEAGTNDAMSDAGARYVTPTRWQAVSS